MNIYFHKLKIVVFTLGLILCMNMAGILQLSRYRGGWSIFLFLAAAVYFLYANIRPYSVFRKTEEKPGIRLWQLGYGTSLISYAGLTFIVNIVCLVWIGCSLTFHGAGDVLCYLTAVLFSLGGSGILLWNGCLRLMATSVQMGIRYRIALLFCWWIPAVNCVLFAKLYELAYWEYETELEKIELDAVRKEWECCHTRYPVLMVHGVFFRDSRFLNYWGRVPKELIKNGALICYGDQHSAATVEQCGQELAGKIASTVNALGCGKVNIIAHSKGGLDARCAISQCGMADYVASLTTINTPHRGCLFADYLLEKAPKKLLRALAKRYNATLRRLGEVDPDFIGAVSDLTASACRQRNERLPDCEQVYYQSVASSMKRAQGGRFPLNMTYQLARYFDGENDGLVSVDSALWGNVYCILRPAGRRGISHGDMIDLNRENVEGFDVREFYVNLVRELKEKGF